MMLQSRGVRSLAIAALLALPGLAGAAPLFTDNFDTDTSANWKVLRGYYFDSVPDDYTVDWAFDYSQQKYKRYSNPETFEELPIPPAPNSSGTSRGVKISVNKDATAERFAVNLYPVGQSFGGNYTFKFDVWLNYNGPAEGGIGSTEHFMAGINHSGNIVNWSSFVTGMTNAVAPGAGAEASDGIWVATTGEGGAAIDGRVCLGTTNSFPRYYAAAFLDRDGDNSPDNSDQDAYVAKVLFPQPKFETAGAPGKRWVEMEISQIDGIVTWKVDGKMFARFANPTGYTSGNIMIGAMDIFPSIADPGEENFVIFDNIRVEAVRQVVVNTTDNGSGPGDGKTSLKEALAGLQENDLITFAIPGDGPHVIATPIGGYPLITKSGVTLDGYTQPGAAPNTNPFLGGNNARIQIVLDSTSDAQAGDPAKPDRASTRLPFPGYGDSENAVLGVYEADGVTIRGFSFIGRHTPGSDEDPSIYSIALVKEARNARVQGNWFGLAPNGKDVKGLASGVSGFRHRVNVGGVNVDTFSGGLVVGTDSDGLNDLAEFNIFAGLHIGLALELPEAITAGNYFNVLPDGKTFLSVEDILLAQQAAGLEASVENYENGRLTTDSVIGVRGDRINDENEGNLFNFAIYDHLIEFYSNASNLVVAGNRFGVGVDGIATAPVPTSKLPNLFEGPGSGSIRIGSNHDGVSDTLEGNLIYKVPGNAFVITGKAVPVVARGNRLSGNGFDSFLFVDGANSRPYAEYYAAYVADPENATPTLTGYTGGKLSGTIALPADGIVADVDIYVTDPTAPAGAVIPHRSLGTLYEGGPEDLDPATGKFTFDLSSLGVPGGRQLCVVVTYSALEAASEAGSSVTGPVSNAVDTGGQAELGPVSIARDGSSVKITYTGILQSATTVNGPWTDVAGASSPYSTPPVGGGRFFRARQ